MKQTRCYKYPLYPTDDQEQTLIAWAGARRFIWNWALNRRQDYYKQTGKSLRAMALNKELTILKRQTETLWLYTVPNDLLQNVFRDLDKAFANFFAKRSRFPKLKKKATTPHAMRFNGAVYIRDSKTVRIPKMGHVKARVDRFPDGETKSATVKQDAVGKWWIIFVAHEEWSIPFRDGENPIGIDMGLSSFATLSNGTKIDAPRFYRRGERQLRKAQRIMARKQRGSKNRLKAKNHVARIHEKIRNRRESFLHRVSKTLVQEYTHLCIEDLNIKGLVKTKLAKSFTDAGIGSFIRMLRYKSAWYGAELIQVDRFYPSSKTCSVCGQKTVLTLSQRSWTCAMCHTVHDRDVNAAINILNEGIRTLRREHGETLNASGDHVRLPTGSDG